MPIVRSEVHSSPVTPVKFGPRLGDRSPTSPLGNAATNSPGRTNGGMLPRMRSNS
jgi:hypothetical protein